MSLTHTRHLFGGINETGLDHFLAVFFTARPHLLAYGSPFYATNPSQITLIDTSSLPSFLSGLQFLVRFSIPTVDITPPDSATEPLPPGNDQFTLSTKVQLRFLCGRGRGDDGNQEGAHEIVTELSIAVLCTPDVVDSSPGTGSIGIRLIAVQVDGIEPKPFEQILECILAAVLRWALAQVRVPFMVFTVSGVSLTLQEGPTAENNEIDVRGDIT